MGTVLIALCGLGFSGKSVLARFLSHELGIPVPSYDIEIYPMHRHLVPPGSSAAAEYDFVQDIARERVGTILAGGQSLIYDDVLLERDDRRLPRQPNSDRLALPAPRLTPWRGLFSLRGSRPEVNGLAGWRVCRVWATSRMSSRTSTGPAEIPA